MSAPVGRERARRKLLSMQGLQWLTLPHCMCGKPWLRRAHWHVRSQRGAASQPPVAPPPRHLQLSECSPVTLSLSTPQAMDLYNQVQQEMSVALAFRERLIPDAVLWFTGEAVDDDDEVREGEGGLELIKVKRPPNGTAPSPYPLPSPNSRTRTTRTTR